MNNGQAGPSVSCQYDWAKILKQLVSNTPPIQTYIIRPRIISSQHYRCIILPLTRDVSGSCWHFSKDSESSSEVRKESTCFTTFYPTIFTESNECIVYFLLKKTAFWSNSRNMTKFTPVIHKKKNISKCYTL